MTISTLQKPAKRRVELADGLRWAGGGGWLYTRKYDGVFTTLEIAPGTVLIGELMRARSGSVLTAADRALLDRHGQFFAAHSLASLQGQCLLREPTRLRWSDLCRLLASSRDGAFGPVVLAESGHGGEFLQAVLAAGGEGVCATRLDDSWGEMYACKREETIDAVIVEMDAARGTIRLGEHGQDLGWCPARAAFQELKIGQVVEVSALGRTAAGKLREARFVRRREDKHEA